MIDLIDRVYGPDDFSDIEDGDGLDHSTPTAPAAPTAPATSNAPTSSTLFAQGTDAWAKARATEIAYNPDTGKQDRYLNFTNPIIPDNVTETTIADAIAEDFFKKYPATLPELLNKTVSQAYYGLLTNAIGAAIATENSFRDGQAKKKLSNRPSVYAGSILIYALASTDAIRIIRYESEAKACQFAIREYVTDADGIGHYTGIWIPFEFTNDGPSALRNVIQYMLPGIPATTKRDILDGLKDKLYERCKRGTSITKDWGFRLIFARNGIIEGYADGRPVKFTPWDDIDTIEKLYPGLCPLYRLTVDYNPHAVCPANLNPDDYIASLFDAGTPLGQSSARMLMQSSQFAIRTYAGAHGYMCYLINGAGGSKGRNGKSTYLDLLMSFFSANPEQCNYVNTQIFAESFEGFDSACLQNEVIHVADEMDSEIKGVDNFKRYIRYGAVTCRRKNLPMVRIVSYCFKAQAANQMPDYGRQKSKNLATFNRNIVYMFDQDFAENGTKCDPHMAEHLQSKEFMEYFLLYLTQMPFVDDYNADDLAIVDVNRQAMVSDNMPTQEAIEEILTNIGVSVLPFNIVYDLYCGWAKENKMYNTLPKNVFKRDLEVYCLEHGDKWRFDASTRRRLTANELVEYQTVKDCDVIIDYAEGCTWSKFKSVISGGLVPAGGFSTDVLQGRKYTGFVTAV